MLIGEYTTHPAADVFPLLEGAEFDALCEDIREHGLREPITRMRFKGRRVVLDGRNRLRACLRTGMKPSWRDYEGTADGVLAFVLSCNLHRRHLDESQRAMVAARIATLAHGVRADRVDAQICASTQNEAAGMLGVARRTVQHARRLLDHGAPELVHAVDQGELAVSAAADLCELSYPEQVEAVQMVATGEASNTRQAVRRLEERKRAAVPRPERVDARVLHGDAVELVRGLEQRPHLVVTDPPYGLETHNTRRGGQDYADGQDYIFELLERLCAALGAAVDPGAHLYFFAGYTHAAQVKALLQRHFVVQDNPLVWVKDNHTMCDFAKHYPNKHEYIWFCRTPTSIRRLARCVPDVIECDRQRDSTHSAEKPVELLSLLIEQSSVPGELVLDPFCGSGSTGVAARSLARQFIGIEQDQHWAEVARARIA